MEGTLYSGPNPLGGDFGTILRASKTILALKYVLAAEKLFWKGSGDH